MSRITDVLVLLSLDETWVEENETELVEEVESAALEAVNSWLRREYNVSLVNLSEHAFPAGDKAMQALVYGGAFNRLDEEEFLQVVRTQNWVAPDDVQILMKSEGESRFTLYTIPTD